MSINEQNAYYDANRGTGEASYGSSLASSGVAAPRNPGPSEEAESTLQIAQTLNKQLDELEGRLFGPEPTQTAGDAKDAAPQALSGKIRYARQRLDTAASRLGRLIQRL